MPKMVAVYSFSTYAILTDRSDTRPVKGTAEAIKRAGGTIIEGTKEMVDESLLDGAKYYRPAK